MSRPTPTLSFEVVAIKGDMFGGVPYMQTVLREYVSGVRITITGAPWSLGSKVNFIQTTEQKLNPTHK